MATGDPTLVAKQAAASSRAMSRGVAEETRGPSSESDDGAEVPTAFELYRNPGSNVEAGLLRRRRAAPFAHRHSELCRNQLLQHPTHAGGQRKPQGGRLQTP